MADNVELFDTHNRLNFPSEAQIALLPKEARQRFATVRLAKQTLDKATKRRESLAQAIKVNDEARFETKTELDRLRPKWTAVDNIKAHIASEQAQRRAERGL